MYSFSSIFIAILYFAQLSTAQEKEYLDKYQSPTTPEKAVYYRLCKRDDMKRMQGKVLIYRIEGSLYSEVNYIDGLRDGYYVTYHLNGNMAIKGMYEDDHRVGTWEHWYDNRQKQREDTYIDGKHHVESYWDRAGKQTLKQGTGAFELHDDTHGIAEKGKFKNYVKDGAWVGYFDDGRMYFQEVWSEGKLTKGISHDDQNKTYSYDNDSFQTLPAFMGGQAELEKYLEKNKRYPKKAQRAGVAGKVVVKFTVEIDGKITHPHVIETNSYFNEEALRLVQEMPAWKPALLRGQEIKRNYILPINFKL